MVVPQERVKLCSYRYRREAADRELMKRHPNGPMWVVLRVPGRFPLDLAEASVLWERKHNQANYDDECATLDRRPPVKLIGISRQTGAD